MSQERSSSFIYGVSALEVAVRDNNVRLVRLLLKDKRFAQSLDVNRAKSVCLSLKETVPYSIKQQSKDTLTLLGSYYSI